MLGGTASPQTAPHPSSAGFARQPTRGTDVRIHLVSHYYPPEVGAPQARLSEMARRWAERGHRVTVLTGMPNHPTGVLPDAYRGAVVRREERDGVRVLRSWLYATPNEGFLKKTLGHLSFMVTAVVLGMPRAGRPDVVVVSSPTFFAILSAWFIARVRRARLVVEVRDLWPAIFVELGVLKNRMLIRLLERLELAMYAAADAVVVVSEGFRDDLVRRGVPEDKVVTIRNGVDLDRFDPGHVAPTGTRERLGCREGETLVLYIGAHGISQGLATVVEAASYLQDAGVHVALVGEGADKKAVAARLAGLGATNVTMLPGVTRDEVADCLAAADICLVPLRDVPLFDTFLPSKMFELMGAGRPVLGSVRGESARILGEAGQLVVPPGDAQAIARAIRDLAGDAPRRTEMGRTGRTYVEAHFDRRVLADRYLELLELVRERGRP
jgi:glycosyltransferase involved in cell wall biosynthesis